jgi:transposase-like protein
LIPSIYAHFAERQTTGQRRSSAGPAPVSSSAKIRWRFSAEEKIRIVIEGLRGEPSITALWRREDIAANLDHQFTLAGSNDSAARIRV